LNKKKAVKGRRDTFDGQESPDARTDDKFDIGDMFSHPLPPLSSSKSGSKAKPEQT
jgi:hypothetical protein